MIITLILCVNVQVTSLILRFKNIRFNFYCPVLFWIPCAIWIILCYPFKASFSVQSTSLHLSPSSERAKPPPIKVIEFFII